MIWVHTIGDTSTARGELTVTLNKDNNGDPGDALCTLTDPTFTSSGVQTFDTPATCPTLATRTTYFVVIERVTTFSGAIISLNRADSTDEGTGGAMGWSIGNDAHFYNTSWSTTASAPQLIEVSGASVPFPADEFNTLGADGVTSAYGIWSDGTNMWVAHRPEVERGDTSSAKLFAYNMSTKQRDSTKDFNTLDAAGNDNPR